MLAELSSAPASMLAESRCREQIDSLFAASPYFMQTSQRYLPRFRQLLESGSLLPGAAPPSTADHCQAIKAHFSDLCGEEPSLSNKTVTDQQMAVLRQFRHTEMLRILWHDLGGFTSVDGTLEALSNMADACIQVASAWAHATVADRYGSVVDDAGTKMQMIILGMGKLGGHELNVSSDIDLIYIYPRSGRSDGAATIDSDDYFRRVAQLVTQLLGNVTVDGFAFRVDTRLRPFGESGPLVMNINALEQYYLTQGRDWERYAMIKARPITGNDLDIEALYELLVPFVYRRYLDYSAIDSLRELKRKISLSVKQKGMRNNI